MGRARHLAVLAALVVLATGLRPASAATATGTSSVVLSLAQRPGAASALHQLARSALAPAAHGAAAARAATDRRTALARLAPDATHQDAVVAFARAHGLQVLRADGWSVTLGGPADTLARLFGTTLTHGRAASALAVPAALRADVGSVVGLDDRPLLRPHLVPGLTSAALRLQYGVPLTGWGGSGVTVGTLNLTGWDPTDLTTYATAALLPLAPGQVTTVPVDNPPNPLVPDGSGNDIEVAMDAEAILAAAPQARQRMYFAPNNGVGTVDAFNQMAADGAAGLLHVASTSWGLCERDLQPYPTYVAQVGQAIDRMLAAGVTLFAAAGDSGIYDCSTPSAVDNTPSVDFPASYPGTVAVGGTRLGLTESAWGTLLANPGTAFAGYGGGGGRSALFGRPSYQVGVGGSETQRLVPDVASVADPSTGLGIYNVGSWMLGGGTSLGAPTWAGLTAAALSGAGRTTGLGDVHGLLYAHPEGFRDITSGSNGYPAGTGFDLATGLGTPVWSTLGPLVTSSATAPAPAPAPAPAAPAPAPAPAPTDTAAPTSTAAAVLTPGTDTRVRFSWAGQDPAPSAGLGPYRVQVTLLGSSTVWATTTAAKAQVLRLLPGRTYVLTVRSSDLAGHVGPAVAARVTVPLDDTAFGRAGRWSRAALSGDYLGAHLLSRTRGSAVAATVYGRTITLGFVRAPYAGYADVYVDGVRVRRLDLWARTTLRRQSVRVLAATRPARHTVRVVVVGTHRSGATGNWVMPDSVLAVP
jgi:kumamolisin